MKVLDQARVVIYRFHEAGLEVFLVEPKLHNDPNVWRLPSGELEQKMEDQQFNMIQLDDTETDLGESLKTYAIEADWHEIPSIRGIIKHDVRRAKNKVKQVLPCLENGAYHSVKEAFKKVLPQEYAALKELKDVLIDRNTVTNF